MFGSSSSTSFAVVAGAGVGLTVDDVGIEVGGLGVTPYVSEPS